jgi:hypothetical protein
MPGPDARVPAIAEAVAARLTAEGAQAVVLAGSHVRGEATELSDVDLYVIGDGPSYRLEVADGLLLAVSWRTPEEESAALENPARIGEVIPAWRNALILADRHAMAARLQRSAEVFDWKSVAAACDAWVAEQTVGYSEEVLKLVAARRRGDALLAAVQRAVLALRLPGVMAVQRRLLYESENELWRLVAEEMGPEWARCHAAALGLDPAGDPDRAALRLFELAHDEVAPLMDARQRSVADFAARAAHALERG